MCSMARVGGSDDHWVLLVFFFQAEDGIRDLVRSRGLGDVYKRQELALFGGIVACGMPEVEMTSIARESGAGPTLEELSLIHI